MDLSWSWRYFWPNVKHNEERLVNDEPGDPATIRFGKADMASFPAAANIPVAETLQRAKHR